MVADWMSRMYSLEEFEAEDTRDENCESTPSTCFLFAEQVCEVVKDPDYYMKQVHGGRMLHHGARKTWQLLNEKFPGHRIPFRVVKEFVKACPRCQKDRLLLQ